MSILSNIISLFSGGARSEAAPVASVVSQSHGDCTIFATPVKEGSQYRLAGQIEKQSGGETLVRNFLRADVFTSLDDANECALRKARQIIDQNGAALFADGEKLRQV